MSKGKNRPRPAAAATPAKPEAPKAHRTWRLPVMLLFFVATWVWAAAYYGPVMRICREYSFWVANPEQMKFVLDLEGGWLWYVGRMLLQTFRYPWLGGLLLAALLSLSSWMLGTLLRLAPRWRWMQYVPALAYMGWMTYSGLDLFFESETGRVVGLPALAFVLLALVSLCAAAVRWGRPVLIESGQGALRSLAVIGVGFLCLVGFNQWQRPYVKVISEMMIAQYNQDWGKVQKIARSQGDMSNRPMAAYYAIALVHTDQIVDRLYDIRFEYDTLHVHGYDGAKNTAVAFYLPEGSYHGGFMLACIHQCMEQMVMSGPSMRLLHLSIKAALMRGEWELAEKYFRILEDVPFERDFIQKYRPMVRHMDRVNADPEMAKIRLTEPLHDSYENMYQSPTFLGYNLRLTEGRSINALYNSLAVCLYTKLLNDFVYRLDALRGTMPPENIADGILLATNNYPGLDKNFQNMNLRQPRIQGFMNVIQPYMQDRAGHADELFTRYRGYYPYYYFFENLRATNASQKGYVSSSAGIN